MIVTAERVIGAVCLVYKVRLSDLVGPDRHAFIAVPRMLAMYLCRNYVLEEDGKGSSSRLSFPRIGALFDRHHTTVMAACARVVELRRAGHPDLDDDQIWKIIAVLWPDRVSITKKGEAPTGLPFGLKSGGTPCVN